MSTSGAQEARTPGGRSWVCGDVVVHRVEELTLPDVGWLLPELDHAVIERETWLDRSAVGPTGGPRVSVHTFVLRTRDAVVVVDTGVGNGRQRDLPAWNDLSTDYPRRLTATGVTTDEVTLVVNTHWHRDHVGWNTHAVSGSWEPMFPGARYVTSRAEAGYWDEADLTPDQQRMMADSIVPVRDAGLLDTPRVDAPLEIAEGITLVPTPGHTPGHVSVRIDSQGHSALITGDALHHPAQVARPELACVADVDQTVALRTRLSMLAEALSSGTSILGTHVTEPAVARVTVADGRPRLVAVDPVAPPPGPPTPLR